MKNAKRLLAIGTVGILAVIFIINMGLGGARHNAHQFLTKITKGNFEAAFDYVYYFDNAYDEDVTISYEQAKQIWVSRVKQLREEGTYIKSFEDFDTRHDDGWENGYVALTVVEKGKEIIYEHVYIALNQREGKWKVANLQVLTEAKDIDRDWEKAYRGYVGK